MLGIAGAAGFLYRALSAPVPPPPPRVAADPFLLQGRAIYLNRCASCHGQDGRGDGPIAAYVFGPPVGNLSDGRWKHGDKPEGVLGVISKGVPGTRMAGWDQVLEPEELRAVTAYIFCLAQKEVPEAMR
jgi:cytochrome c oxidase cbb3-type subunit 3